MKRVNPQPRQLFLRLVTLGEGTEDTRRRVLREELEMLTTEKSQLSAVIDLLGKARLLTFDRDPITRGATIEVAHEALLREWSRLREWLSENRADIRLQRQLAAMVNEWQNADRDASFLLTGTRLEQFEGWSANTSIALTQDEKAYLEASIAERDRRESEEGIRQQRELENARKLAETERQRAEEQTQSATELRKRSYYLTGAFATALVLAIAATFFGKQAQNSSRLATSRELAAASISNLEVDPGAQYSACIESSGHNLHSRSNGFTGSGRCAAPRGARVARATDPRPGQGASGSRRL